MPHTPFPNSFVWLTVTAPPILRCGATIESAGMRFAFSHYVTQKSLSGLAGRKRPAQGQPSLRDEEG